MKKFLIPAILAATFALPLMPADAAWKCTYKSANKHGWGISDDKAAAVDRAREECIKVTVDGSKCRLTTCSSGFATPKAGDKGFRED